MAVGWGSEGLTRDGQGCTEQRERRTEHPPHPRSASHSRQHRRGQALRWRLYRAAGTQLLPRASGELSDQQVVSRENGGGCGDQERPHTLPRGGHDAETPLLLLPQRGAPALGLIPAGFLLCHSCGHSPPHGVSSPQAATAPRTH